MMKINQNENTAEIKFNKKLYTKESILDSIKNYLDIAKIELDEKEDDYFKVEIKNISEENISDIANEFSNYVFGSMFEFELNHLLN